MYDLGPGTLGGYARASAGFGSGWDFPEIGGSSPDQRTLPSFPHTKSAPLFSVGGGRQTKLSPRLKISRTRVSELDGSGKGF